MLLSIIVPVYNTPIEKLDRCLLSISKLEIPYECIIVDDGSVLEVARFCQNYCINNDCFKYISQNNSGVSAARNNGINNSDAEYICFVDSDDEIVVDAYSIESFSGGEDIIFTDMLLEYLRSSTVWKAFDYKENKELTLEMVVKQLLSHGRLNGPVCKFIKKDFLDNHNIRFNISLFEGEDALFIRDILGNNPRMKYINSPSYIYYKEFSSLSSRLVKYKEAYIDNSHILYEKSMWLIDMCNFDDVSEKNAIINHLQSDHIGYTFSVMADAIENKVFDEIFKNKIHDEVSKFKFNDFKAIGTSEKVYYFLIRKRYWFVLYLLSLLRRKYLKIKGER